MRKVLIGAAAAGLVAMAVPAVVAQEGGNEAPGWEARLDQEGDINSVLHFRPMGAGVHATTGGRGFAIFWRPGSSFSGDFSVSATFTQMEPSGHPNAYGLFFGGSDLQADNQQYSYFMLRQGGEYLIRKRMGEDLPIMVDWTAHDAINDLDANGSSMNTLEVEFRGDRVRFLVNNTEVATQPRSAVDSDGIAGLRVTHLLDLHISDLNVGS